MQFLISYFISNFNVERIFLKYKPYTNSGSEMRNFKTIDTILQQRLPWWPSINIIYGKAAELRSMFTDTLNKVTQGMATNPTPKVIGSSIPYVSIAVSTSHCFFFLPIHAVNEWPIVHRFCKNLILQHVYLNDLHCTLELYQDDLVQTEQGHRWEHDHISLPASVDC